MAEGGVKKTMASVLAATTMVAGGMAQTQPVTQSSAVAQTTSEKRGGFWNTVKKVVGLPYDETEYWDEENERGIKSTAERGLWGLWTYKEDSYNQQGNREETRYYKGNSEVKRDEFHASGKKSWTGDIKNSHPIGRVKKFDELGQQTFDGNYDDEGKADGIHRQMKNGVVINETPYDHGSRQGEERIYAETGSLKKTIPWDKNKRNGVEHNLENGDYITYRDDIRDGAFRETRIVQNGYEKGSIEQSGVYEGGRAHIAKERVLNSLGEVKRETNYDEQGEKHGEERISNGVGYDVNPYNHGRLDGIQTKGGDFTTWKDGVRQGPFKRTSVMAFDEEMHPLITASEKGECENGREKVESKTYHRIVMNEDGSFGSISLTEQEAHKELTHLTGGSEGMKSILKKTVNQQIPKPVETNEQATEKTPQQTATLSPITKAATDKLAADR